MKVLVSEYRNLRAQDLGSGSGAGGKSAYRITVRQLESMVRLSEALARLHLAPVVSVRGHVTSGIILDSLCKSLTSTAMALAVCMYRQVTASYVREAARLLRTSIIHVDSPEVSLDENAAVGRHLPCIPACSLAMHPGSLPVTVLICLHFCVVFHLTMRCFL